MHEHQLIEVRADPISTMMALDEWGRDGYRVAGVINADPAYVIMEREVSQPGTTRGPS